MFKAPKVRSNEGMWVLILKRVCSTLTTVRASSGPRLTVVYILSTMRTRRGSGSHKLHAGLEDSPRIRHRHACVRNIILDT